MYIDKKMSAYLSNKVIFVFFAIVAVLIAFFVIRYIVIKRYETYSKDLTDEVNSAKSSPNLFFLNKVKNMINHDEEIAERYIMLNEKYNEIDAFLKDEIEPKLTELDQNVYYRKILEARKEYHELKPLVDRLVSDTTQLEKDLNKIIEIDSQQKNYNIELQQSYRELQQKYDDKKYQIEDLVPDLGRQINGLEEDFKLLNQLLNDQNYKECRELGDAIKSKVEFLQINVRDLPYYISFTETLVPEQVEQLEKRSESMSELGYALDQFNVSNRIFSIKELVKYIRMDIQALKIETVGENIEKLNNSIKSLTEDLDAEEAARGDYSENCKTIFAKVRKVNDNHRYAVKNYRQIEERYIITDPEMEIGSKYPILERINDDLDEVKKIINSKNFSYKDVMTSLNEISARSDEYEKGINYFFEQRDEMKLKETRAKQQLKQINSVLLLVKSEIKNANLPSISDDYLDYINDTYQRAAEIQEICAGLPINLEVLSTKTDEAIGIITSLYKNVHNLIVTAQMVEETIVYGNRYRSDIVEMNNTLTQVELLFRNGEYFEALRIGLDMMYKIDPEFVDQLTAKDPTK